MSEPQNEPEQITLMKRVVELAEQQTELARDRTRMSVEQSRMSEDRSRMSAERSEMSETRSYLNAERTLSVWVRTALSLMIFGIAIDRFGILLHQLPGSQVPTALRSDPPLLDLLSTGSGVALVALGVVMVATTGLRFLTYARTWRRRHELPAHHGPYLAAFFALMVVLFGILLLVLMLIYA